MITLKNLAFSDLQYHFRPYHSTAILIRILTGFGTVTLFKENLSVIRPLIWGSNHGHQLSCWFYCWKNSSCYWCKKWISLILMKNHPMMTGFRISSKLHWSFIAKAVSKKIEALIRSWSFFLLKLLVVSIKSL